TSPSRASAACASKATSKPCVASRDPTPKCGSPCSVPETDEPLIRLRQSGMRKRPAPTLEAMTGPNEIVNVRYMVDDVRDAIDFYAKFLDFEVLTSYGPAFANVTRGNLRLLLSGPTSSAGRPMPDGAKPGPGGKQVLLQDPSGNVVELFQPAV